MLPFWAVALLGFLATARITRFLNSDYLFKIPRDWFGRVTHHGHAWYLLTCPWCLSIWVAAPIAATVVHGFSPYTGSDAAAATIGLWLGYSWLYGKVAALGEDD